VKPALSLKARALQWLAQLEHSRLELRRKLLRCARAEQAERSDPPDEVAAETDPAAAVEQLLDWLEQERHLSQPRFVESRVHARASRFGNQRIRHELSQHGLVLDADTARTLETSELGRARSVWARKFGEAPGDASQRARQMRFLAGRGFSAAIVRQVVREAGTDAGAEHDRVGDGDGNHDAD
jgi:regulatory protein